MSTSSKYINIILLIFTASCKVCGREVPKLAVKVWLEIMALLNCSKLYEACVDVIGLPKSPACFLPDFSGIQKPNQLHER